MMKIVNIITLLKNINLITQQIKATLNIY